MEPVETSACYTRRAHIRRQHTDWKKEDNHRKGVGELFRTWLPIGIFWNPRCLIHDASTPPASPPSLDTGQNEKRKTEQACTHMTNIHTLLTSLASYMSTSKSSSSPTSASPRFRRTSPCIKPSTDHPSPPTLLDHTMPGSQQQSLSLV